MDSAVTSDNEGEMQGCLDVQPDDSVSDCSGSSRLNQEKKH